jgi:hypothetical protein
MPRKAPEGKDPAPQATPGGAEFLTSDRTADATSKYWSVAPGLIWHHAASASETWPACQ